MTIVFLSSNHLRTIWAWFFPLTWFCGPLIPMPFKLQYTLPYLLSSLSCSIPASCSLTSKNSLVSYFLARLSLDQVTEVVVEVFCPSAERCRARPHFQVGPCETWAPWPLKWWTDASLFFRSHGDSSPSLPGKWSPSLATSQWSSPDGPLASWISSFPASLFRVSKDLLASHMSELVFCLYSRLLPR